MAKKSTKKFQKNHLKRTIGQRKVEQAYKKKISSKSPGSQSKRRKAEESAYIGSDAGKQKGAKSGDAGIAAVEQLFEGHDEDEEVEQFINEASGDEGDADFTAFLDDEDKAALKDDSDDDEEDDEDIEDDELVDSDQDDKADTAELSKRDVAKWRKGMIEEHSMRALKKATIAFRAAVNVNNQDEQEGESTARKSKYTVTSADVYNDIIMTVLTQAPEVLRHHFPGKTDLVGKKFRTAVPMLKSIATSLLKLLGEVSEKSTVAVILRAGEKLLPFFKSFRKLVKQFVRLVIDVWSTAQDESTRLLAWVVIRSAAESKDLLELCMKTSYTGMVKNSRSSTTHTMPLINFMKNTAATLYDLDAETSYRIAFDYIRQLAIHLRRSVVHKTKDSYKDVYNWQFVHSLDFWRRVLSNQCNIVREAEMGAPSPLRPLIYPFVQVTLGTMRLIPAAQYLPLRFTLFRALVDLSRDADVYIPLLPTITEVLVSTAVTRAGKPGTLRSFDFDHNIRAGAQYLGTRVYQTGVCEQIVECVAEFYGVQAKHIAFPELIVPCVVTLKRYARRRDGLSTSGGGADGGARKHENARFEKQLLELVEKLEENSKFIQERRRNVEFAPGDRTQVDRFLEDLEWEKTPLGRYLQVQREVRAERQRLLAQENTEEEK
ncbi:Noc2p family-domain-containing protein [Limtongia smithiae]|uniref:Noc2p family-domain-containing protein n=1 Tax=Limtongia smithiae TaxID=1125753 RepID=UPI0034CD1FE2